MTEKKLIRIIGRNVRRERVRMRASIEKLAEWVDVSPGYIGFLEHGTRGLTMYTLGTLAEIFDVSIGKLLDVEDSRAETDKELLISRSAKLKMLEEKLLVMSDAELDYVVEMVVGLRRLLYMSGMPVGYDSESMDA